jgi:hypothetical protein
VTKDETIQRLCCIVTAVGDGVFKNLLPHDCFCHPPLYEDDDGHFQSVHEDVLDFIDKAVEDAIYRHALKEWRDTQPTPPRKTFIRVDGVEVENTPLEIAYDWKLRGL